MNAIEQHGQDGGIIAVQPAGAAQMSAPIGLMPFSDYQLAPTVRSEILVGQFVAYSHFILLVLFSSAPVADHAAAPEGGEAGGLSPPHTRGDLLLSRGPRVRRLRLRLSL